MLGLMLASISHAINRCYSLLKDLTNLGVQCLAAGTATTLAGTVATANELLQFYSYFIPALVLWQSYNRDKVSGISNEFLISAVNKCSIHMVSFYFILVLINIV